MNDLSALLLSCFFTWMFTMMWLLSKIKEHEKATGKPMNKFRESVGFIKIDKKDSK